MRKIILLIIINAISTIIIAQTKNHFFKGMYIQWGYNTEWYTKSNIHFKLSNGSNFIVHNVKANDKPDFDAILKKPFEISIPQYNYRFGFYLNDKKTKSIELNFDHAKYVVTNYQKVRVTGIINNQSGINDGLQIDADSILNPATFFHMEHTDGANWLHINYTQQRILLNNKNKSHPLINLIYKIGAGINIPRTDFTWKGDRYNNDFHVAGYNAGIEGGFRYFPFKHFFFEATGKSGYVRYVNALANTTKIKNSRLSHGFGYFELIGLIGYDINF